MAWGGARPGAGRKKASDTTTRRFATRKVTQPESKAIATVPAEAKPDLPAIDPRAWAMMLPEIEEISRKYSQHQRKPEHNPFVLPKFPKAAIPPSSTMAMDTSLVANLSDSASGWLAGEVLSGPSGEGLMFPGYSYLSELAQRPEYRVMSETIADDATRKWIDFDVVGDETKQKEDLEKDPEGYDERLADPDARKKRVEQSGKLDRVKALKDDQLRLGVKDRFYEQARNDGFFGRTHLLLDIWTNGREEPTDDELKIPIGDGRSKVSKTKVPKGSFKSLRTIEPVWTYPQAYNAVNPLRGDWYSPQTWYVMGKEIHGSRLLTFVGHPVSDMLKPAYAFGGISLTQMAKPYVDIWLQTRQSIADLIHSFSVMVLMTDLSTLMQPGNVNALLARVAMFNMLRDNQGTFVVNKTTEDFKNVSAQLSGLHELQSQAQEHMASVHRIPLVKFTGIQPAGLNASSEGEIEVYDDTIGAYQSRFLDHNLSRVINFEHLSLWGEIDPEITHRWEPLRPMTQAEKGQKEKDDADRDQKYADMGAISPGEIRKIIIENKDLPYTGLDPDDVPEPPAEEGMLGPGAGGAAKAEEESALGEPDDDKGGGANDAADPFGATDAAEWKEGDHPRAENGQFGSGGGGKSSKADSGGIPDFLKKSSPGHFSKGGSPGQILKMPQFGLTATPWESHQGGAGFALPPRKPAPRSSGEPDKAGSLVAFTPGDDHGVKELNGVAFKSWDPPADWAGVDGQAKIDEPPLPELPDGMTLSSGAIIREADGRVWIMRPSKGFGGYDQTFPKGGVEDGLSPQANAIKEVFEETGLQIRITGFAGDHEGDTTVSRYYMAERVGGDPKDAGWEAEGVILAPADQLDGLLNRKRDKAIAASLSPAETKPIDPASLKKIGGKMGSNEGGTFEDPDGQKYYIKRPQSKAHVENELAAARLYQLAGVNTLDYIPVKGGNHVATRLEKLDKKNIKDLTAAERKEATKDFAVHAWLGNYDAAGTGGDNQGVLNGKVTTLDVGGSLRYRAQGAPKGAGFGPKVKEIESMRGKDPGVHAPDAAALFGKMSEADLKASAARVTSIPDEAIRQAAGSDKALADTLIARKGDLASRYGLQAADEANFEESKHPRAPDGKFSSGGGGSSGGGESTPVFSSKKAQAAHMLSKGVTKEELAKALGWPQLSMTATAKQAGMTLEKYTEGGVTKFKGTPMSPEQLAAAKAAKPKPQKVEIKEPPKGQTYGEWKEQQGSYKPQETKPKHGPATAAELQKAAKTGVPLQMQYVPNAASLTADPAAKNLVSQFNEKWLSKKDLTPAQLQEKVDDFKDLNAAMIPLMGAAAKQQAEAAEKAKAEAAAKAKELAAKAAVQAKRAAEKNKEVMSALGISEQQAEGVVELAKMLGSSTGDIVQQFEKYEKQAQGLGYPITGFQCALIKNYSNGGFGAINAALRSGSWSPAQHAYVAMVNKALMGMPKYEGSGLTRNTTLSAEQQKAYVQGHIVQENAFMSTSTGSVFSGNTKFKITAIGKRGASIQKLSNHPGENEVLFAAKTYFKVNKVEGAPGGSMTIHLEEWEEHV